MLGIFAKVLRGESVKTRLHAALSPRAATAFYVASLADTLETAVQVEPAPTLFLAGAADAAAVNDLRARVTAVGAEVSWERLRVVPQSPGDLGARMEAALVELCRAGRPALLVGSDSPALGPGKLRRALAQLQDPQCPADVVLGPTPDGGYWCLGVRKAFPGLLEDIAWSTPAVFASTRARARARGLRVVEADPAEDVDVPEDLRRLREAIARLRADGDRRTARHVEAFLSDAGGSSNMSSKTR